MFCPGHGSSLVEIEKEVKSSVQASVMTANRLPHMHCRVAIVARQTLRVSPLKTDPLLLALLFKCRDAICIYNKLCRDLLSCLVHIVDMHMLRV